MFTYFIDIDNTICITRGNNYINSIPIKERIEKINSLYELGHRVVYWTARGSSTSLDYRDLTIEQLDNWGCLRHDVQFNKPSYDFFIDDKAINSTDYFTE